MEMVLEMCLVVDGQENGEQRASWPCAETCGQIWAHIKSFSKYIWWSRMTEGKISGSYSFSHMETIFYRLER